jgi:tellurite resistance protein
MSFTANMMYIKEHYGSAPDEPPRNDQVVNFAKALKIIASADGEMSDMEWNTYAHIGRMCGASEELLSEVRAFDGRHAKLDDYLKGISDDNGRARQMLYDAVMVASSDGYAKQEREATARAGQLLGIDRAIVQAIEAMAESEVALRRARGALLVPKK